MNFKPVSHLGGVVVWSISLTCFVFIAHYSGEIVTSLLQQRQTATVQSVDDAIEHRTKVCVFQALESEPPFTRLVLHGLNVSVKTAADAMNVMEASRWRSRAGDRIATDRPGWLEKAKCVWTNLTEECYCEAAVLTEDAFAMAQTGEYSSGERRHCNKRQIGELQGEILPNALPVREDLQSSISWAISHALQDDGYENHAIYAKGAYRTASLCGASSSSSNQMEKDKLASQRRLRGVGAFAATVTSVALLFSFAAEAFECYRRSKRCGGTGERNSFYLSSCQRIKRCRRNACWHEKDVNDADDPHLRTIQMVKARREELQRKYHSQVREFPPLSTADLPFLLRAIKSGQTATDQGVRDAEIDNTIRQMELAESLQVRIRTDLTLC